MLPHKNSRNCIMNDGIIRIINSIKVPVILTGRDCLVRMWNDYANEYFSGEIKEGGAAGSLFSMAPEKLKEFSEKAGPGTECRFDNVKVLMPGKRRADVTVSFLNYGVEDFFVFTVKDKPGGSAGYSDFEKLLSNIESSPSSIVITDRNGLVEYVNENFSRLTGYLPEEIKGENINILKPGFFSRDNPGLWDLIEKGKNWKGEFLNVKKDGDLYWAIVSISPLYGRDGGISHYLSIQEDITYLKRAEEELKQSEEKLRILFESLPEGILVTDLDGNIMQVNRAYLRIFGYPDRMMISGKNIHQIFESAGDKIIVELFSIAVAQGFSGVSSYELRRGSSIYLDLQVMMISDEEGIPQRFLLLADDVTSRKHAEKALRESEARNRALVDAIPDIMFRVDNEGVYLDKMLGTKINEVFPPEIAAEAVKHIAEAVKTREIQIFEYPVTISMEERFYEARFVAIDNDEILIIIRNTTEKRKALDEIENARRDAELANRAKSEFLANMSHEIRTPLNSITGFIELLMRTGIDEAQREYLGIIKKSASGLLEIINDILDFSKIESHKLEISRVEFNPYPEFESVIRLFNVKAQEKGIKFISFIDPLLPSGIISDPLRLKQIMSNLLSNAIKFTPENGTVITEIKLSRLRDDICMINFSVSDTGIGIPERKQKQIFEAFAQADSSVTRRYGGTGLGLSISSSLVKLLGSEIVLDSRMGIGSKFYFTLETEVSRGKTMKDSFPSCHDLNACIVSYSADDLSLLNIEYYLQSFGFNISFATDFKKCGSEKCDILFVIDSDGIKEEALLHSDMISSVPAVFVLVNPDSEFPVELRGLFRSFLQHPLLPEKMIRVSVDMLGIDKSLHGAEGDMAAAGLRFRGKVLVGEDNRINQKLMTLLLGDYGVEVHVAGNGLDVFDMYKKGGYDLILMDINMPVADGVETARMILDYEKEAGIPHVPVIALTAKVIKRDKEAMLQSGMDGYLAKPVEMDRLEEILVHYLVEDRVKPDADSLLGKGGKTTREGAYDIKKTAAELKIPVNVLESIGRDFFEDLQEALAEMRKAMGEGDMEMIRMLSHKMKGAAANLRLNTVRGYLDAVEENSESGNKEFDYGRIFDDIELELIELKSAF